MTTSRIVRNESRTTLPTPWFLSATIGLVLVGIYVVHYLDNTGDAIPMSSVLYRDFALVPQFIADGEIHRLITANLLHANLWCLAASLLTLALVGSEVERRWGARRFIATGLIVALTTTLATLPLAPLVSRWATGTAAMLGLVATALVVARRAGFRVWLIALVGVFDLVVYLLSEESSIWSAAGAMCGGALAAFLLISAPDDRRRDRVQAIMLGGLVLALIGLAVVLVVGLPT